MHPTTKASCTTLYPTFPCKLHFTFFLPYLHLQSISKMSSTNSTASSTVSHILCPLYKSWFLPINLFSLTFNHNTSSSKFSMPGLLQMTYPIMSPPLIMQFMAAFHNDKVIFYYAFIFRFFSLNITIQYMTYESTAINFFACDHNCIFDLHFIPALDQ